MKNECESCGRMTSVKGLWGVYICKICCKKYNEATNLAIKDLILKYKKEFEKLRDKRITEIFKW